MIEKIQEIDHETYLKLVEIAAGAPNTGVRWVLNQYLAGIHDAMEFDGISVRPPVPEDQQIQDELDGICVRLAAVERKAEALLQNANTSFPMVGKAIDQLTERVDMLTDAVASNTARIAQNFDTNRTRINLVRDDMEEERKKHRRDAESLARRISKLHAAVAHSSPGDAIWRVRVLSCMPKAWQKIYALLRDNPTMPYSDITKEVNRSLDAVQAAVRRFDALGLITCEKDSAGRIKQESVKVI